MPTGTMAPRRVPFRSNRNLECSNAWVFDSFFFLIPCIRQIFFTGASAHSSRRPLSLFIIRFFCYSFFGHRPMRGRFVSWNTQRDCRRRTLSSSRSSRSPADQFGFPERAELGRYCLLLPSAGAPQTMRDCRRMKFRGERIYWAPFERKTSSPGVEDGSRSRDGQKQYSEGGWPVLERAVLQLQRRQGEVRHERR